MKHDLAWVINPIEIEMFLSEYWCKKPLFIDRGRQPYYRDLIHAKDLDEILRKGIFADRHLEIIYHGGKNDRDLRRLDGTANMKKIYNGIANQSTLLAYGLEKRHQPIGSLCYELNEQIQHPHSTGVFYSPPNHRALGPHLDPLEVFVLQIEGEKRWKLYDPIYSYPNNEEQRRLGTPKEYGQPDMDVVLRPGDLLYMPRGTLHDPSTDAHTSLHVSIGFFQKSWGNFTIDIINGLKGTDHPLNQPLPVGYLTGNSPLRATLSQAMGIRPTEKDVARIFLDQRKSFSEDKQVLSVGRFRSLME